MDKTKKKIKTIGKVSCIILTIMMIFMIVVSSCFAIAGTGLLIVKNTSLGDKISQFIETSLSSLTPEDEAEVNDELKSELGAELPSQTQSETNTETSSKSVKDNLKEMTDNIRFGSFLTDLLFENSDIDIPSIVAVICLSTALFTALISIYLKVMRSIMKTLSSGEKPFTVPAAKKLRRLSFAMLLLLPVNFITSVVLFVLTLMFSYLFEYGAYLQSKADETSRVQEEMIMSFAEVTENKSEQTGQHVRRVAEYTKIIATEMGMTEEQIDKIRLASTMHDIGKLMIPADILEKPARLTDEEFATIKMHSTYGGKLLNNVEGDVMQLARTIALEHHERIDGKGYPDGKTGDDISIEGRIVAVADVYDALTSKRSYKEPWDHQKAFDEIVKNSGTQFDPQVIEAFKRSYDKINEMRQIYADAA